MLVLVAAAVAFIITVGIIAFTKQRTYRNDMIRIQAFKISTKN